MHQTFQQDLLQLRLKVARMYSTVLTSRMLPITFGAENSLKVSAQVYTSKANVVRVHSCVVRVYLEGKSQYPLSCNEVQSLVVLCYGVHSILACLVITTCINCSDGSNRE